MNNAITLYDETEKVAAAMVKSGYFQDSRDVSQAIVKILAGREMGFGAFASMTGVYIISGRPSVGANLMASAVKRSGRYDYRVNQMTDTGCEIEFFQAGKPIGRSCFTLEDAKKAGTKNLDKFPRNMLFARAMSNGVRWYCPDVFDGAPVYTPEELGADVTESGDVIAGSFVEAPPPANGNGHAPVPTLKPLTPLKPVTVEGREMVETVVGYVDKAVWDKHAERMANDANQGEPGTTTNEQPAAPYNPCGDKKGAKIGKHDYPPTWARIFAAYTRANAYEVDGILQQHKPAGDMAPEAVVELVNAHLAEKAAQS